MKVNKSTFLSADLKGVQDGGVCSLLAVYSTLLCWCINCSTNEVWCADSYETVVNRANMYFE